MKASAYDAVVVGSGPNGLAAAIVLQQAGLSVLVMEANDSIGGGMRTRELTLPGFKHDICSAVHPMAISSPFFSRLPLGEHGLAYIQPAVAAAHPFDDGQAAAVKTSVGETARSLGPDGPFYEKWMGALLQSWPDIYEDILGPIPLPSHPLSYARFGIKAILPASRFARMQFKSERGRGYFAGMAAHAMVPLQYLASSAIGLVLMVNAHAKGWPIPKGGAQSIADALGSYFTALGGEIALNTTVSSLSQIPTCKALLLDVSPKQLFQLAGQRFSVFYNWQLKRFRTGMGVFKMDWALDEPVPFISASCREAGTIHIGASLAEIEESESLAHRGILADRPFVLLAQPSVFDPSRAPAGKHVLWGYCHTPHASTADRTSAIEEQIERYAPGFRERILCRHSMNSKDLEAYNPNYDGGDINGGEQSLGQLFTRPVLRLTPYRTAARGIYLCSASTPPGGGVHGMCGYHAAHRALKDIFLKANKRFYVP